VVLRGTEYAHARRQRAMIVSADAGIALGQHVAIDIDTGIGAKGHAFHQTAQRAVAYARPPALPTTGRNTQNFSPTKKNKAISTINPPITAWCGQPRR